MALEASFPWQGRLTLIQGYTNNHHGGVPK